MKRFSWRTFVFLAVVMGAQSFGAVRLQANPGDSFRVCLSPGHPSYEDDKLYEAILNRKVVLYLTEYLRSYGFEVLHSVEDLGYDELFAVDFDNEGAFEQSQLIVKTPREKVEECNRWRADFFISVHHNFSSNEQVNHTLVMYAEEQNYQESFARTRRWAELTARNLVMIMSTRSARVEGDYGLLGDPLTVLLYSEMPGILTEAAFYSHPRERSRLNNNEYLAGEAWAIFEGFLEFTEEGFRGE